MAFQKLLVANRGEIAIRVLRTARELGWPTAVVFSEADADAPPVAMADEAICIGPAPAAESYLNAERVLDAARRIGADAIHPGYGFLSENAAFARACVEAGVTFVGPGPEAMASMGDKSRAKAVAERAGVPTVPGWKGEDQSDATLAAAAEEVGFPLLVKASAGGGGRGMRRVDEAGQLARALASARQEAVSAFGDGRLLLERLVEGARHVEVQVFADTQGNVIHLGERDCSMQRRYQKVLEEAPSPAVNAELRARMGEAAVALAREIGYVGAGTVEFLLGADGDFYFLEMNTRLQVEHPVTELVCGLDLVELQLRVAAGEALPIQQSDVILDGHAIEARIYAEDPYAGHLPQTGTILAFDPDDAPGVRCDHAIEAGSEISAWYDPMIGKLITWGSDREQARRRLVAALDRSILLGPQTNKGFLGTLLQHPAFVAGEVTTRFLDEADAALFERPPITSEHIAVAAALWLERAPVGAPWRNSGVWDIPLPLQCGADELHELRVAPEGEAWKVSLGETEHCVHLLWGDDAVIRVEVDGLQSSAQAIWEDAELHLHYRGVRGTFTEAIPRGAQTGASDGTLRAPMAGAILSVGVTVGDAVSPEQVALTMEAMKIETPLKCGVAGTVTEVRVAGGDRVQGGEVLVVVEPEEG